MQAFAGFLNDETMVKVPISDVSSFFQDRFAVYWTKKHRLTEEENNSLEVITSYFDQQIY